MSPKIGVIQRDEAAVNKEHSESERPEQSPPADDDFLADLIGKLLTIRKRVTVGLRICFCLR